MWCGKCSESFRIHTYLMRRKRGLLGVEVVLSSEEKRQTEVLV